jgi:hypothetical protein
MWLYLAVLSETEGEICVYVCDTRHYCAVCKKLQWGKTEVYCWLLSNKSQKGLNEDRSWRICCTSCVNGEEVKHVLGEYILIWLSTNNVGSHPSFFRQMASGTLQVNCDRPINNVAKNVQYRWLVQTSNTNASVQKKNLCQVNVFNTSRQKDSLHFFFFSRLSLLHYSVIIVSFAHIFLLLFNIVPPWLRI